MMQSSKGNQINQPQGKEDKNMTITKDVIRATVAEMKHTKSDEEIESYFKAALKAKSITIDNYYDAMKSIYA